MKRRTKAELVLGGGEDEERRRFEPSVWRDVREGDSLLEMEIFGPFLPIVPVEDIDEAIEYINYQCVVSMTALVVRLADIRAADALLQSITTSFIFVHDGSKSQTSTYVSSATNLQYAHS